MAIKEGIKALPRPDTCLFYAVSGVGKTTLLYYLALMMYRKYGLKSRLISNDLGNWGPIESEGLIKAGIVQAFNVSNRPYLLSDMRKLSRGEWVYGVKEREEVIQENGSTKIIEKVVKRIMPHPAKYGEIGLYFVEGATTTSTAFLAHITKQQEQIGPQDAAGRYVEDGEQFGANSKGHYNIVQREMHNLFGAFSSLPAPVRLVAWTAHTGMGTMKRTGESCYAPQLAGSAVNAEVPSWVGECFHLEDIPETIGVDGEVVQEKQVRAYYVNHLDKDTGVPYLAKSRVGPSGVRALREKFPGGFVPLGLDVGKNIDAYFDWLEERNAKSQEALAEWMKRQ